MERIDNFINNNKCQLCNKIIWFWQKKYTDYNIRIHKKCKWPFLQKWQDLVIENKPCPKCYNYNIMKTLDDFGQFESYWCEHCCINLNTDYNGDVFFT